MRLKFLNLALNLLLSFLFLSCYREERIQPANTLSSSQPSPTTPTVQTPEVYKEPTVLSIQSQITDLLDSNKTVSLTKESGS